MSRNKHLNALSLRPSCPKMEPNYQSDFQLHVDKLQVQLDDRQSFMRSATQMVSASLKSVLQINLTEISPMTDFFPAVAFPPSVHWLSSGNYWLQFCMAYL